MLEALLALLLAAAPSAPFSPLPADSWVAIAEQVGNGWDPDGNLGHIDPSEAVEGIDPETKSDVGGRWDPDGELF